MRKLLLLCFFLGLISAVSVAQTNSEMANADSLFNNYKFVDALNSYNKILEKNPRNLNALWHSSLLYSRVGNGFKEKDRQKEYFNKAKERAQQALAVDSTDTHANFVMAAAMGRMALIVGNRERVAASRDIKKYADRALKADSTNAGAWHILGRWNYEIANLNFAERLAANVLFGGIPSGASTEKAVEYIKKAIALGPDISLYFRDLANAYKKLDQNDKAVEACRQGLKIPVQAPDDEKIQKDCREIIKDLQ